MRSIKFWLRIVFVYGFFAQMAVSLWGAPGSPYFTITNAPSVTEGSGQTMNFTITLNAGGPGCKANTTYSVDFQTTTGGTAQSSDYVAVPPTTVNFTSGNINSGVCATATIPVTIVNDTIQETDETVAVTLTNPSSNAILLTGYESAAGIIIDDDSPLSISINDASIAEMETNVTVRILLTQPAPAGGITLDYQTASSSPVSAISPDDYTAVGLTTITIPEGALDYNISIPIHDDTLTEGTESFLVQISNASYGTIAKDTSKVLIFDNESAAGGLCSSYVGMITINEYQNNPNYFDITHNKIKGNYVELKYIDDLVKQHITDDWKLTLYSNQTVVKNWSDRDQQCTDPAYEVFQYDSNAMGDSVTVVLTDQNGNEVDLFNLKDSQYYVQQCHSFVYDTNFTVAEAAAINSQASDKEFFRYPDGTGDWSTLGLGANSVGSRCLNIPGSGFELVYRQFDAIDTDEPVPSIVTGSTDVPLKTKIANQPFDVRILSLNTNDAGQIGALQNITATMKVYLANGAGGSLLDPTGYLISFADQSSVVLSGISLPKAAKNVKIWFEYCQDASGVLHDWDECFVGTTNEYWQRHAYSRNSFAVRPDKFDNTSLSVTPNLIMKAGLAQSLDFMALNGATPAGGAVDYNESQGVSFAVDVNLSDTTKVCAQKSMDFSPSVVFGDGNATNNYSLPNVGDFNVTIHEIMGSEFAIIDADDTNDSMRIITPYEGNVTVIPDHFTINGIFANGSNGFTYLSNFEHFDTNVSKNVSAALDINVSAMVADNTAVTTNYTSTCYAKNGDLNLTLANPLSISPTGALSKMLWAHVSPDNNGSISINGTAYYNLPFLSTQFDTNDTNGTGQFNYLINFDRNETKLTNPFNMVISEINATDADSVEGNQTLLSGNSVYYVYGRIIPRDIRVFGDVDFTANGWYEVYNASVIGTTALAPSRNGELWYTNQLHNDISDGDGNVTILQSSSGSTAINAGGVAVSGVESYNFTHVGTANIPYTRKAHVDTDPWLWYGANALDYTDPSGTNLDCLTHPCFNVNVVPAVGSVGSATGSTLQPDKANKTTKTTGVIYDYTPATR